MSATGTWLLPARAFELRFAELKTWRDSLVEGLAGFRRWALVSRLIDEQTTARLAHLERRIASGRMTIAFVAEYSRGKSELINALFFADLGARLLPSGEGRTALCPIEIAWDPLRPAALRLLPIETRALPDALRELASLPAHWTEVPLDASKPETIEGACEALAERITVSAAEATGFGFAVEGSGRVEIPRWRYAMLNVSHPLLASGLGILDLPGADVLRAEPELETHRLPDAAAIVFMLPIGSDATSLDLALWSDHIAPLDGIDKTGFVVLDRIDALREDLHDEERVLGEIDRETRTAAETLRIAPTRIFALSARQGLAAKISGDRDKLLKSRIYRLEQALAQGVVHQRRLDVATTVLAEMRSVLGDTRKVIDSRASFAAEQRAELAALQAKNQKLVQTIAKKTALERARLEKARAMLLNLRTVHNRHADALGRELDRSAAREAAQRARAAVEASRFSGGNEAVAGYFREVRERLERSIAAIAEVKAMIAATREIFARDYGIEIQAQPDFATERFLVEIDRLEAECSHELKRGSGLFASRKALAARFSECAAEPAVRVFEIADREVRTWMNGFIRPLDDQLNAFQEQTNARIEGMGRIQHAEGDLIARLEELESMVSELDSQREQWEAHNERLLNLLAVERELSLA